MCIRDREYASRGGAETLRHYGSGDSLLRRYAWFGYVDERGNPPDAPRDVGTLLPNQYGLFDSLGNVDEWCQTWFSESSPDGSQLVDGYEGDKGQSFGGREYRGGSFYNLPTEVFDSRRDQCVGVISNYYYQLGIRVAVTLP